MTTTCYTFNSNYFNHIPSQFFPIKPLQHYPYRRGHYEQIQRSVVDFGLVLFDITVVHILRNFNLRLHIHWLARYVT